MKNYRQYKQDIVLICIAKLQKLLIKAKQKDMETIPVADLQIMEHNIESWLIAAKVSDRYINDTHICATGQDGTAKTHSKNDVLQEMEKEVKT